MSYWINNPDVWETAACNRCGCLPEKLVEIKSPEFIRKLKGWKVGDWRFVECPNCRLRFYSPRLKQDEQWFDACMRNEASRIQVQKIFELGTSLPISKTSTFDRVEHIEKFYGKYLKKTVEFLGHNPRKLYELGSNIGRLLDVAVNQFPGISVAGCDPCPFAVEICKEHFGIDTEEALFQDIKNEEKDFDIVIGWNFIEHSFTPCDDIRKAHLMLAKGGILLLRTFHEEGNADDYQTGPVVHQHHFLKDVLCGIVEETGFEITLEVTGRDFFVYGRKR